MCVCVLVHLCPIECVFLLRLCFCLCAYVDVVSVFYGCVCVCVGPILQISCKFSTLRDKGVLLH